MVSNAQLILKARSVVRFRALKNSGSAGNVGCALVTDKSNIYLGVCINTACGMGFCAEHSAIASMVTNGEQRIKKIVSVLKDGTIIPPCGRCREFMRQIDSRNNQTEVLVSKSKIVKLKDLLPFSWDHE